VSAVISMTLQITALTLGLHTMQTLPQRLEATTQFR